MKIKELIEQIEKSIRADIDDSEGDLDHADFKHAREVSKEVIDRCELDLHNETDY